MEYLKQPGWSVLDSDTRLNSLSSSLHERCSSSLIRTCRKLQRKSKLSYTVQTNSGGWDRDPQPCLWSHFSSQKKDLRFRRCVGTASTTVCHINVMISRECFSIQRATFVAVWEELVQNYPDLLQTDPGGLLLPSGALLSAFHSC